MFVRKLPFSNPPITAIQRKRSTDDIAIIGNAHANAGQSSLQAGRNNLPPVIGSGAPVVPGKLIASPLTERIAI